MKLTLVLPLLIIMISISACKKAKEVHPENTAQPTTGTISGIALPVGITKSIAIISGQGVNKVHQIIPDPITGAFSFVNVNEGNYLMDFSVDEYYSKPKPLDIKILPGENKDVGTIIVSKSKFGLSCNVNGQYQGWNIKATYNNSSLQIASMGLAGTPQDNFSLKTRYRLSITLNGFTGPGTYTCDGKSGSTIIYRGYRSILVSIQSTDSPGSVGTVEITDVDPVKRTIKGSFTATLASRSQTTNDARIITNGLIDTVY